MLKHRSAFSGPADFGLGILARCSQTGAIGAGIANSTIAAGSRCLHVDGDVAAVLVMAFTNQHLGPLAIKLLRDTLRTDEIFALLKQNDRHFAYRQIGILPAAGDADAFSGDKTPDASGRLVRRDAVALGNGLPDDAPLEVAIEVVTSEKGSLEHRLATALRAGTRHLRDTAEIRSASLLVGIPNAPRRTDLRVDHVIDPSGPDAVDRLLGTVEAWEPLIPYYRALPENPEIGSWRDWTRATARDID